jgi:hypothetical protein
MDARPSRSEIWFDKEGKAIPIVNMDDDYLRNAHRHVIRQIIRKVGELDASRAALEDGRISDEEQEPFERMIAGDLLGLEKDLNNLKREIRKRNQA